MEHVVPPGPHLIETYAAGYRPGMTDLSCPSPDQTPSISGALEPADLRFSVPGGSLALRTAITRLYEQLEPADILVTNGASEALAALAAALGGTGQRIAVAPGSYPSFTETARLAGTQLVAPSAIEGTCALVLTNPEVPGGRRVAIEQVIEHALAAGAVPVVDEVYRHIALDGQSPPRAAADCHPLAVSVGDLSKSLGLGGLRIGWIATRNGALREAAARWLRIFTGGASVLSEAAACHALASFDEHVEACATRARAAAEAVYEELASAGWAFDRAELGLTVCTRPPHPLAPDAIERLSAAGFFLLPADSFGHPGEFRIGLLTPPAALRSALRMLRRPAACATDTLVVLMRIPAPGVGKSRLAVSLGTERTFALATAFAEDTLRLSQAGDWRAAAAYASSDNGHATAYEGIEAFSQTEGDLGTRIAHALVSACATAERTVLIGSDTPDLPPALIEQAFAALDDSDAVLGPAVDGGFYLIGVRATHPGMFAGVEWSRPTVFARTLENMQRLGWRVAVLDEWQDVDDATSLLALARRLASHDRAPATRAALAAIGEGWRS